MFHIAPIVPLGLVDLAYVTVGVIFAFLSRIPLAALSDSSDGWGDHSKILAQRRGKWIRYDIPDSAVPGTFPRPALSHFLVSRFPTRFWRPASVVMNSAADVLVSIFVYWSTFSLLSANGYGDPNQVSIASFSSMMMFLTLPLLVPLTARLQANNGRSLGLLFTTGYFISLGYFLVTGTYLWLVPAGSFIALVILTSTFATQVVAFFSLILALCYTTLAPILVIGTVVGLGFALRKTGVRDLIYFAINHTIWFVRNIDTNDVSKRTLLSSAFLFPYHLFTDLFKARSSFFQTSPLLIGSYSAPPIWLFLYAYYLHRDITVLWADPMMKFFSAMVLCGLIMFLITSVGVFRVLGEAERYLEYASPMFVVAAVVYSLASSAVGLEVIFPVIIIQIGTILFIHAFADSNRVKRLLEFRHSTLDEFKGVVEFLKQLPGDVRVATMPLKLPRLLSLYTNEEGRGRIRYYYRFIFDRDAGLDGFRRFDEDTVDVDVFAGPPARLKEKYGIEYIVVDKGFLETVEDREFVAALAQTTPIYQSDRYDVYRV